VDKAALSKFLPSRLDGRVPSLGDPQVVDRILGVFVKEAMDRYIACAQSELSPAAYQEGDRSACLETAKLFLGLNPFFQTVPEWNCPGAIDEFLVRQLNIGETEPILRLATALSELLIEMHNLRKYAAEPGILEEQWVWQVGAIIETYRNFLLGVPVAQDDD
jgi:hypothetical protein